jgi:outer membrane protein assembly factor BamB
MMSAVRWAVGHGSLRSACLVAGALAVLAACSSGPAKPKPGPLEAVVASSGPVPSRLAWSQRAEAVRFPLEVARAHGMFAVAGDEGGVLALDAGTGRELWRGNAGAKLSGGVGSDGRLYAVATRDGNLVVLESGRVLWTQALGVRVATRPLVAGERVFVLATDRSVHAFDGQTGGKLWSVRRPGDALTLNQAGVLLAVGNTLLAGQGSRLAGLDPSNGGVSWEVPLATPRGTNEIERLADLVGPAGRAGEVVCARAFQAAVACVNAAKGSLLWTRNVGGTQGVASDAQTVVAADASDRVTAWRAATGEVAWTSDALSHRKLSAPVLIGSAVAFGDAEGTVHVLSRDTGKTVSRLATDGSAVETLSLGADAATLLAVTRNGGVFAFRP